MLEGAVAVAITPQILLAPVGLEVVGLVLEEVQKQLTALPILAVEVVVMHQAVDQV
jgi:hypothetical protein